MLIALFQEKKIKNYDILVIQESWRLNAELKTYNEKRTIFTLIDNDGRTCFYVNKRINANSWHSTWHFKDVEIITFQIHSGTNEATHELINIHEMYNSLSNNHNEIVNKGSLLIITETMRMQSENAIVKDFNLHHPFWAELSYLKQHLLASDLLNIMHTANASLTLSKSIVTRDYQSAQITINLSFTTSDLINKLIYCGIDEEMKNSSNHLPIKIILNLKTQAKPQRKFKRN